jgi:glycosyltransferase involved in cell wall biosynthesis
MATCFIFPSLYEGFGLPVLEAMNAGCPVITSNTSSLLEVAGNAGLLVDPLNAADIAQAIYTILDNDAMRLRLIQDGHQQAARFSWETTAGITRNLYLQVCNRPNHFKPS